MTSASQWSAVAPRSLRPTASAVLVFACGIAAPVILNVVGEMYGSELLLPVVALLLHFRPSGDRSLREPAFAVLLGAAMVTLAGYVMSDLVQGTRPDQFMRGWGRIGLIISDFVAMAAIFGQDRRHLWWYVLGSGLGQIIALRFVGHAPITLWKFGYAEPVVMVSSAISAFLPPLAASAWIALLGLFSMWMDFRSFAAICLAIAAFVWLRSGRHALASRRAAGTIRLALMAGVVAVVLSLTLSMTQGTSVDRRVHSDAGRQAAIEVGLQAVLQSPFVGYGSWAENKDFLKKYIKRTNELRGGVESSNDGKEKFNPHSQILHAWFEGGILGTAFLVAMLVNFLALGRWLLTRRPADALTPLLAYFVLTAIWDLFMSPFSAPHRLGIAMGAAIVVISRMEQRLCQGRKGKATAPPPMRGAVRMPAPLGVRMKSTELRLAQRRIAWRNRTQAQPALRVVMARSS